MLLSSIPAKIAAIFAASGTKNAIPLTTAGVSNPNNASYDVGFPAVTMETVVSGGLPPFGADFNGILNALTAIQQWQGAGGLFVYDSAFSTSIGGYPKGAQLLMATGLGIWQSTVDNNTSNPDTGGADWTSVVLLNQYAATKTATGSATFPSGIILKWGQSGSIASGGVSTITFETAFPNNCLCAMTSFNAGGGVLGQVNMAGVAFNATQIQLSAFGSSGGAGAYYWFALGF